MQHLAKGSRQLLFALLLTCTAGVVHAVDGVIEINDARAIAGGITGGDGPGYFITIDESGSYRLTGNLDSGSQVAIRISAPDVTLDLNGFTIKGDGTVFIDGVSVGTNSPNVEIRNGTIRDFGRHGIFALSTSPGTRIIDVRAIDNGIFGLNLENEGSLVRGCTVTGSGSSGIRALGDSTVLGNTVMDNGAVGLTGSIGTGYGKNVFTENNGGSANPQVSGGVDLGDNVCGTNTTCP